MRYKTTRADGAIGSFMLHTALHSLQTSHRLRLIGFAPMARCDGTRSEHHP